MQLTPSPTVYFAKQPPFSAQTVKANLSCATLIDNVWFLDNNTPTQSSLFINNGTFQGLYKANDPALNQLRQDLKAQEHIDKQTHITDKHFNAALSPGLIESHIHGGNQINFNTASVEDMIELLKALRAKGITTVIPTLMTDTVDGFKSAFKRLNTLMAYTREHPDLPHVPGIAIEGPYISPHQKGAHDESIINGALNQGSDYFATLLQDSPKVLWVTLAPETPDANAIIQSLTAKGIAVHLGHSAGYANEYETAIKNGASGITHLYNQMGSPVTHREPLKHTNPITWLASTPLPIYKEIIADSHHISRERILQTLLESSGRSQLIHQQSPAPQDIMLVSDASPLAGCEEGQQTIFGNTLIQSKKGKAINPAYEASGQQTGVLAGSTVFVNDCVKNIAKWTQPWWGNHSILYALKMATTNIADHLKLNNTAIQAGNPADFTLWDLQTQQVTDTYLSGVKY